MKIFIKLLKYFSLMMCVFAITSCEKLEEEPSSFMEPENFYNTPAQVESAFAASMNSLWVPWANYGYTMHTFNHDDQLAGGNLVIGNNHGSGLWAAHYKAISNLNAAIVAINKGNLEGTPQEDIDMLMGQAKFLRAYNYFMLVRMFGPLPLITEDIEDPYTAEIERSPLVDVYGLIENDLLEAFKKLPPSWPDAQKGRPTADAAKGMLAKVYLTMATYPMNEPSCYQLAADMAKQVIDAKRYALVKDVYQVFSVNTKYGPEMMFGFNSNYEGMATDPHIWTELNGWGDFTADILWTEKFPDQPRKDAYMELQLDGKSYLELGQNPGIRKYLYDTEEDFNAGRSIVNIPILRFADVLLIYAEAANMANGGPTEGAVVAINKVIDRANGYVENSETPRATLDMTQAEFDTRVIEERNWELSFEFDRWFDLVRKRILKEESREDIQQNYSDDDLLFPIPENDLRLNPLLKQNPGYGM